MREPISHSLLVDAVSTAPQTHWKLPVITVFPPYALFIRRECSPIRGKVGRFQHTNRGERFQSMLSLDRVLSNQLAQMLRECIWRTIRRSVAQGSENFFKVHSVLASCRCAGSCQVPLQFQHSKCWVDRYPRCETSTNSGGAEECGLGWIAI